MKITVSERVEGTSTRWVLDYTPEGGKRVRRFFKTKTDADAAAREQQTMVNRAGQDWVSLSTAERADLITGYAQIKAAGLTLHQVLEQWRAGTNGATQPGIETVSLQRARDEWITARELSCGPRRVRNCTGFIDRFIAGRSELPISSITLADCKSWLSPFRGETYNSYRDMMLAFFAFCRDHKYVIESVANKRVLPKLDIKHEDPVTLTNDQVRLALRWAWQNDRELLAYLAIAIFIGCRPEEIDKMDWSMFDLERSTAYLPAGICKDRRSRLCHLEPAAVEWLKLAQSVNSVLPWNNSTRLLRMKPLRAALGFDKWPQDVLRHTFGSNHVEKYHELGKTSLEMGNSAKMIMRDYRKPIDPVACAEFWALTPESVLAQPQ